MVLPSLPSALASCPTGCYYNTFVAYPISEPNGTQAWDGQFNLIVYETYQNGGGVATVCNSATPPGGNSNPISCSGYTEPGYGTAPSEIAVASGNGVWAFSSPECDVYEITSSNNTYVCNFYLTWLDSFEFTAQNLSTWDTSLSPIISSVHLGHLDSTGDDLGSCTGHIFAGNTTVRCNSPYPQELQYGIQVDNGTIVAVPQTVGNWCIQGHSNYLITSGGNINYLNYTRPSASTNPTSGSIDNYPAIPSYTDFSSTLTGAGCGQGTPTWTYTDPSSPSCAASITVSFQTPNSWSTTAKFDDRSTHSCYAPVTLTVTSSLGPVASASVQVNYFYCRCV